MIITIIKALSPQNQIDNIIQLNEVDNFLFTKSIGVMKAIIIVTNTLLALNLCS